MRIDEMLASKRPVFSAEFFPPKTEEGRQTLFETVDVLRKLGPNFFSVTYGAGGATREGTVEITKAIRDEHGAEAMAHLSCVGETTEALREIVEEIAGAGIENILALRGDPPRGQPDFVQPEGGLGSASELTKLIAEMHPEIANKNYLQERPEDFERAIRQPRTDGAQHDAQTAQNSAQHRIEPASTKSTLCFTH